MQYWGEATFWALKFGHRWDVVGWDGGRTDPLLRDNPPRLVSHAPFTIRPGMRTARGHFWAKLILIQQEGYGPTAV